MLDRILATISILMLIGFVSIIVVFVMEPDLSIIIIGVLAMAVYDFWGTIGGKSKARAPKKN
jgi:dolichol kinase